MGREGEPTRTNLTFDSTSSDRFPTINYAQHSAISRVIAALPAKESSWEVLYETANTIGVNGDEPFALLLKLALVSGTDWRSKWTNAKQSLAERGVTFEAQREEGSKSKSTPSEQSSERKPRVKAAGGFDLLQAKVDKVTTATKALSRPKSTAPQLHEEPVASTSSRTRSSSRPRFRTPRTRDFLVRPGHISSSSDDFVGVPSSKYSVDRTVPISSYATPASDKVLPTPGRPSTRHASPPPPSSTRHPDRSRPPLNSPTPRSHPPEPEIVSSINPDYPAQSTHRLGEMEALANTFRRTTLLSRAWESWRVQNTDFQEQGRQIALLRQNAVRNWVLSRWRVRLEEVAQLQTSGEQAIQLLERELLKGAMLRWVERVGKRRRDAWEQNLRALWNVMRGRVKLRVKKDVFEKWRMLARESLATNFRRHALQNRALRHWTARVISIAHLSIRAQEVVESGDVAIMSTVLQIWKRNAILQVELGDFVRVQEARMREMCWDLWRDRLRSLRHRQGLEKVAERVSSKSRLRRSLVKWRIRLAGVRALSTQAAQFATRRDHNLVNRTFEYWIIEYSGALLLNTRAVRLARTSLQTWADKYYYLAADLEGRAIAFVSRKDQQLAHSCLEQWVEAVDRRRTLEAAADRAHATSLKKRAIQKWRGALHTRAVDHAKADVARDFFLHRKTWNRWQEALAQRKVQAWVAERTRKEKSVTLARWLTTYRKAKADTVLVTAFQRDVNQRVQSELLHYWVERVIVVRERELEADAEYEQKIMGATFNVWVDACVRHGNRYSLAKSFRDVKAEGLERKVFRHWLKRARQSSEMRRRLVDLQENQRMDALDSAFGIWRQRFLRPLAEEMAQSRQHRVLSSAFRRWQARTKSLPAIRFERQHSGRRFFDAWRAQVTDPSLIADAIAFERESTFGHFINLWRVKVQARTALRSASRFRTFVASTSTPRQSPPSRGPVTPLNLRSAESTSPPTSAPPLPPPRSPLRTSPPAAITPSHLTQPFLNRGATSVRRSLSIDRTPGSILSPARPRSSPGSADNFSDRSRDDSMRARLRAAAASRRTG